MDLNLVVFFLGAWLVALTQALPPTRSTHSLRAAIGKIAGEDFIINVPKKLIEASSARATVKINNQGVQGNLESDEVLESDDEFDDDMNFDSPMLFDGEQGMLFRWPGGIVPFHISRKFSAQSREKILEAVRTYEKYTCIRFVQRDPLQHRDYVRIVAAEENVCSSAVGHRTGKQEINLNERGCFSKPGVVLHEFMHTLGFPHEHARSDRDSHVSIKWKNIKSDQEHNFLTWPNTENFGVDYDFGSVMHYRAHSFTKNGHRTIVPQHEWQQNQMGQRDGFSKGDITRINSMYKCHLSEAERNELYYAEVDAIRMFNCRNKGISC